MLTASQQIDPHTNVPKNAIALTLCTTIIVSLIIISSAIAYVHVPTRSGAYWGY
jgi:hypothetical protein